MDKVENVDDNRELSSSNSISQKLYKLRRAKQF